MVRAKHRVSAPFQRVGYDVYIATASASVLDIVSPYQHMVLTQKLHSLAALPRSEEANHKKNTTDKYYVTEPKTGFSIAYEIVNGAVYVTNIVPDPEAEGVRREVPTVYLVKRGPDGDWTESKVSAMTVSTPFAAVNGQSNVLERAKELMAAHISKAFDSKLSEYTLFHNPSDGGMWDTYESSKDKRGFTTGVSKQFSRVLANVQSGDTPVKWIAHSQGGVIFAEAVRYHLAQGGGPLSNNAVMFHAGANHKQKTERYLGIAQVPILGYNDHPFDFVPQIIGGHADSVSDVVGSVLHSGWVFAGSPERSPHTLPYQGMDHYAEQMPGAYQKARSAGQSVKAGAAAVENYLSQLPSRVKVKYKLFKKNK